MSASLYYTLVTEFFEDYWKTKAFFIFSMSKQVGDSVRYLTPLLISQFGWRMAWIIGGSVGALNGFLLVFTVIEPKRQEAILLSNDENVKHEVTKQANEVLEDENQQNDYEVKEVKNKVIIQKKSFTVKTLLAEYKRSFGLMFRDVAGMCIILGCFFRLW